MSNDENFGYPEFLYRLTVFEGTLHTDKYRLVKAEKEEKMEAYGVYINTYFLNSVIVFTDEDCYPKFRGGGDDFFESKLELLEYILDNFDLFDNMNETETMIRIMRFNIRYNNDTSKLEEAILNGDF